MQRMVPDRRRRGARRVTLAVGLLWAAAALAPAGPLHAEPAEDPRALVERTLDDVLVVLRDDSLSLAERRSRVEVIAYGRFDFETISRLVLARNWKKLTPEQRDEFVVEFKRHLSNSYWKTLYDNRGRELEVGASQRTKRGDVKVRTEIALDAAQPFLIDYRLRARGDEWKVIDVVIEGVSLVQNFRSQTQAIISDVGVERLIEALRKKNEESLAEG